MICAKFCAETKFVATNLVFCDESAKREQVIKQKKSEITL